MFAVVMSCVLGCKISETETRKQYRQCLFGFNLLFRRVKILEACGDLKCALCAGAMLFMGTATQTATQVFVHEANVTTHVGKVECSNLVGTCSAMNLTAGIPRTS